MKNLKPSLMMYILLGVLFSVAVFLTIDKFNGIKDQYQSMEPNLDNYSTAEILFLAFERTRTAAYNEENPEEFIIKKNIFDSKLAILKNKSMNINSFYYEEDFLVVLNKLQAQSKKLSLIYSKKNTFTGEKENILTQMDEIQPTLIDLQEIIYRIQIRNFNKIKSIIQDNSSYTEATALASIFLLFTLVIVLILHISKLNSSLKDKNIFISAIYHELSGSIQKIHMSRELINMRGDLISAEKYLANIGYHTNKLYHQTKEILEFSKIEIGNTSLKISKFSLHEVIEDIKIQFSEKNGNQIKINIPYEQKFIKSDRRKITSITYNLIDNANKNTILGFISLKMKVYKNTLFIKVSDNGCGFDIEKLNLLFQPFNQGVKSETKQGLGLGLTIIKSHLKTLNGKIRVKSKISFGSTFLICIPFTDKIKK